MHVDFNVVIPARYASTRLPGKPLLDIAGKPMVVWVVEQAKKSGAKSVVVATDDQRIYDVVTQFGYDVVMTQPDHQSGTDRIAEVASLLAWREDTLVINVQGDEPLIEPEIIQQVAEKLASDDAVDMSTACFPINNWEDFINPNVVKVVFDDDAHAMYFSRAPIPYPRDQYAKDGLNEIFSVNAYRHVGIYGYRTSFLKKYTKFKPSDLEVTEKLEQLRVLQEGYKIGVTLSLNQPAIGVDTVEDYHRVCSYMRDSSIDITVPIK